MKKLLFVDDEPKVLSGLRRMLARYRKEWDMHFAEGGANALELMEKDGPFDVIVSDMRMPGMNGVELLTKVQELYPKTVRIILSGQTESDMTLEAAEMSHQFMSKPCDPEFLRKRIGRCCNLQDVLHNDVVRGLLAEAKSLPSLPQLYAQIEAAVQEEDSMDEIGRIISHDIGMTAKVLQIVNSAFFGLPQEISDPVRAASFLGIGTIRSLVLSVEVFSSFSGGDNPKAIEDLWAHSIAVARFAQLIAQELGADKAESDDAFLAGMLHDSGRILIASKFPAEQKKIDYLVAKGMPVYDAEVPLLKTSHAEIGAYLFGIWGLPERVVEATALHHRPGESLIEEGPVLQGLYLANAFHNHLVGKGELDHLLDEDLLEKAGLKERLPELLQTCSDLPLESLSL